MFSNKDLRNLIFPLFIEQFLLMFVGIADTFVVSFSSEADVSGVSLVTSFNTVMISCLRLFRRAVRSLSASISAVTIKRWRPELPVSC